MSSSVEISSPADSVAPRPDVSSAVMQQARRDQRLVAGQNEALQLIISDAPLSEIFSRLIQVVEDDGGGDSVASVLLFDQSAGKLRHGAAPSLPDAYNDAIDGLAVAPDLGTCAAAAATNQLIVTPDIARSPGWDAFKELPLGLGLVAAWSMPITSSTGAVLGTFGTYFRHRRRPTEAEIATMSVLAKTAALAIERQRSAEGLASALRENEQQRRLYETVLSNTPDLVYVFSLAHRFTYANSALLKMWGRTWEDAIGKNCLELGYEPWHAEMHDREIDQVVATKRPVRGEVAFNGTNGRRFYDYIFAPVFGVDGEVRAIAGTTRDVTEKLKAATEVRFLADLAQDLALMSDEHAIIRHTVAAVGRHVGAHRCYFVECHEVNNLIRVSENWVRDAAPSLAGSMSLFDFGGAEWWRKYSGGDFAVSDVASHPLIGAASLANYRSVGVLSYAVQPVKQTGDWTVVLAITDCVPRAWTADELRLLDNVTARVWPLVERARSEAALRVARDEALAASRAKDDFLAVLSHELRTPLNPVLLLASDAAANPSLAREVRADFETIVRNVTLEARLIDDLLDLSRIAHNKLPLEFAARDLHALLRHVLDTVQADVRAKGLQLEAHLDAKQSRVKGDEVRLQQVLWNLLKNAVKFTAAGGRISVVTQVPAARPDLIVVEITDTGIGLTEAEVARVFTPFTQGDHSEAGASAYGGLGVGLALSRKIAELHAGTIAVESPGRDRGATFRLELPLLREVAAIAASAPSNAQAAPVNGKTNGFHRVLLVEDHEASRVALSRLLAKRGVEVVQAGTASAALDQARLGQFDLVISDIGLPDRSGYELMAELRERHGMRGIALSGYGAEDDLVRSRQAGFIAHVTKPVQISALDRALEAAVKK